MKLKNPALYEENNTNYWPDRSTTQNALGAAIFLGQQQMKSSIQILNKAFYNILKGLEINKYHIINVHTRRLYSGKKL
jgi:hypothetical protein